MRQRVQDFTMRLERRSVPPHLRSRFTQDAGSRLDRDRYEIIPWLDRTRHLEGVRILEVGCGEGESTVALAEQGADVIGLDVNGDHLERAAKRCRRHGVQARFVEANAADIATLAPDVDWILFWASLEHMTVDERLGALRAAWDLVGEDGLLTVIETPNRLWLTDAHTSKLPFFNWLPDELAFRYAHRSPRAGFGGTTYSDFGDEHLHAFLRRGRGVSYHEFDLAIGEYEVVSCLQVERRKRSPLRRVGWATSAHGRYERLLRAEAPTVHRAFFQPYLYLTIDRPRRALARSGFPDASAG